MALASPQSCKPSCVFWYDLLRYWPGVHGFLTSQLKASNSYPVLADVTIGGTPAGRVQIELFADVVPKTAENVRQFFTGDYRYLQPSAKFGSSTADSGQGS